MKTKSIGFIGGGRITKIFLQGFKNKGLIFPSVHVYDINNDVLSTLKGSFPTIETSISINNVAKQEIIFIALHPPMIGESAGQLKAIISEETVLVSLAPKISIEKLTLLTGTKRIVRMIPNATSFINQGYNPVCFSNAIEDSEKNEILESLKTLGNTIETEEGKLEAYAVASAMLPTYFWFQWNEMQKIALEMGLSDKEATDTVYESLKAALELMYNSNIKYEEVTDLIPVKPIGDKESAIKDVLNDHLIPLFNKIKP